MLDVQNLKWLRRVPYLLEHAIKKCGQPAKALKQAAEQEDVFFGIVYNGSKNAHTDSIFYQYHLLASRKLTSFNFGL
jgi:hypothetical protein